MKLTKNMKLVKVVYNLSYSDLYLDSDLDFNSEEETPKETRILTAAPEEPGQDPLETTESPPPDPPGVSCDWQPGIRRYGSGDNQADRVL